MKRILACLATVALAVCAPQVQARQNDPSADALGALIDRLMPSSKSPDSEPKKADWNLKATLYHSGAPGVGTRDSLGCQTVAMRTAATDPRVVRRRTIMFIPETVGMKMPDGSSHDGYWYASDTGGAVKGARIDLYTGSNRASMGPIMKLNMKTVSVVNVGTFEGCPKAGMQVASR
ncbi:3D (Asp-Asp-Asp) domain-containing protein [Caulobacter ginsengisoli]|uniref:3D (Asp-Asp-Asp) domain-containing protein n=1 Tax=Caulobacter ginsengisoli TaxID=400775 RepID=A0ABU0IP01_9CAUL|nr:3D domain-containing protein [Caulobacter ginsengisoli]MDQ0463733.1 3D (Asp-Asp-Asp) domain-containing protein [Caulobacter ginsengisoli]